MKIFFILLIALTSVIQLEAQQTKSRFYLLTQLGYLNGDNSANWQGTISGGIRKNGWSLGLGAGIDYYKVRTVPVFLDIRKDIINSKRPLFIYLNMGANLAAPRSVEYTNRMNGWWITPQSSFTNGVFGETGLGYTLYSKKKTAIFVSAGYSIKTVTESYTETIYRDFPPYGQGTITDRVLDYRFNRFVWKIGCRLW